MNKFQYTENFCQHQKLVACDTVYSHNHNTIFFTDSTPERKAFFIEFNPRCVDEGKYKYRDSEYNQP
ncbi:hypothetical protein [Nostoc sp. NMS9]|uniref:hypothetical protein n=1 Tax=Nostoc sp. NMS9 TaxID=2815393 RepID=UPI0025FC88CF|nr:hypothetical protein [Nostoc sp. NMS9]MBN3942406.1 hypothetical protein [Nostoc sp. NMS9]